MSIPGVSVINEITGNINDILNSVKDDYKKLKDVIDRMKAALEKIYDTENINMLNIIENVKQIKSFANEISLIVNDAKIQTIKVNDVRKKIDSFASNKQAIFADLNVISILRGNISLLESMPIVLDIVEKKNKLYENIESAKQLVTENVNKVRPSF